MLFGQSQSSCASVLVNALECLSLLAFSSIEGDQSLNSSLFVGYFIELAT